MWLGNGSPYITFAPDLAPLVDDEIETLLGRFQAMRETLASWSESCSAEQLDAPAEGRTARAILIHILGGPGSYLSPVIGGATGFSRVVTAAERGQLDLASALREVAMMATAAVRATTPAQRAAVIERPKELRTLRKSMRRMLEHDWEHLAELSRRPGGPLR
jgi:hypothetical protein